MTDCLRFDDADLAAADHADWNRWRWRTRFTGHAEREATEEEHARYAKMAEKWRREFKARKLAAEAYLPNPSNSL